MEVVAPGVFVSGFGNGHVIAIGANDAELVNGVECTKDGLQFSLSPSSESEA